MKLSRRCFLSFAIGGAVGTALTPLPWKLTDDLSIWTQNWPWTPVPPDGKYSYVKSTCTLCPARCGIRVRKVDERAVKIEGQEGTPLDPTGGLCPLGFSGLQLLYGNTRIPGPLKRAGERGQDRWEPISWPQAIAEVASRLAAIRSQGKPQSVACLASEDVGTVPRLLQRLMTAYGSPNFSRMPSVLDAHEAVLSLMHGVDGFAGLDVEHADFILSFGAALLEGYGSPPRMMQAIGRLKEQHGTLVQIEQRLSNTAAKADTWLVPRPGTEADLALALAGVIIDQGKYHKDFVRNHIQGFDAFRAMLKEHYAPEAVAAVTRVDAGTIARTALAFAGAKRPLAIYGKGKGYLPGNLKEALAVHALNALVGNINQSGGVFAMPAYDYLNWPDVKTDAVAAAGLRSPRLDGAGSAAYPHARHLVNRLIDRVVKSPGDLQALLVADANPCHNLPDTIKVRAAFDKIPFIVSFSSFFDETVMLSDLILPNHVYLERFEDVPVLAGTTRPTIGLCQPVVAPQLNTQHLGDSVIQIAKALKGTVAEAFPWADYESCLHQALGDQWDAMLDKGAWAADAVPASWRNSFNTASGKLVLMNAALEAIYTTKAPAPAGSDGSYPWLLMPYDSICLTGRSVGDPPFMMKLVPDTVLKRQDGLVALNPEVAAQMGLAEGQTALLSTPVSKVTVGVHLDDGVMPGILSMPRGLGHSVFGPYVAGKGANINQLIASVEDPASGLDAVWGIRAKLIKA
jgi:anaerobic selenocysteine-containing dehydrogenase